MDDVLTAARAQHGLSRKDQVEHAVLEQVRDDGTWVTLYNRHLLDALDAPGTPPPARYDGGQ